MLAVEAVVFVTIAGALTAVATGIGALPFVVVEEFSDRWTVGLWGLASGIMVAASVFGLLGEGLRKLEQWPLVAAGMAVGVLLVVVAGKLLADAEIDPREYEEADVRTLVLLLGVLTVHSFPEGVAVGVSFAELGLGSGAAVGGATSGAGGTAAGGTAASGSLPIAGFVVPPLAVFMTIAISIHNVPEGVAIAIPLRSMDVPEWRMVGWAIFSSLPQPIGAAIAFVFVRLARQFLPFGFGFAAGAMIYLVVSELLPEALETGRELAGGGYRELAVGITLGVLGMVPLALV